MAMNRSITVSIFLALSLFFALASARLPLDPTEYGHGSTDPMTSTTNTLLLPSEPEPVATSEIKPDQVRESWFLDLTELEATNDNNRGDAASLEAQTAPLRLRPVNRNFFPKRPMFVRRNRGGCHHHGEPMVKSWAPWAPMAKPGAPWAPMAKPWAPWAPMAKPGAPWAPMAKPGAPWAPMAKPGTPWAPMAKLGAPWAPMVKPRAPQAPQDPQEHLSFGNDMVMMDQDERQLDGKFQSVDRQRLWTVRPIEVRPSEIGERREEDNEMIPFRPHHHRHGRHDHHDRHDEDGGRGEDDIDRDRHHHHHHHHDHEEEREEEEEMGGRGGIFKGIRKFLNHF